MNAKRVATFVLGGGMAACVACSTSSSPGASGDGGGGGEGDGGMGTGGSGTATVSGTVGGRAFAPMDAIAMKGVYDSSYPGIVTIFMSTTPGLCATFQEMAARGNALKANLFELGFSLGQTTSTSTVVVGTYGTGGPAANELDSGGWDSFDATCNVTHDPGTTAASVTLTSVGAAYVGSFDMTFQGGEHVTGTFTAPLCTVTPSDGGGGGGDAGPACIP